MGFILPTTISARSSRLECRLVFRRVQMGNGERAHMEKADSTGSKLQ